MFYNEILCGVLSWGNLFKDCHRLSSKSNWTKFSYFENAFCFYITENVTRRCSLKHFHFENLTNLLEETCAEVSFSINMCRLEAGGLHFLKKRDFSSVILPSVLRKLQYASYGWLWRYSRERERERKLTSIIIQSNRWGMIMKIDLALLFLKY